MKHCTRMQLTITTLFLLHMRTSWTLGACYYRNSLSFFCCLLPNIVRNVELHHVQEDKSQNIGALAHICGESFRSHFSWVYHQEGKQFINGGSHSAQLELHSTFVGSSKDRLDVVAWLWLKSLRCHQCVWPSRQVPCWGDIDGRESIRIVKVSVK